MICPQRVALSGLLVVEAPAWLCPRRSGSRTNEDCRCTPWGQDAGSQGDGLIERTIESISEPSDGVLWVFAQCQWTNMCVGPSCSWSTVYSCRSGS